MFWVGIMRRELIGPFRVPECVTMTSAKYVKYVTTFFADTDGRTMPSVIKSSSCMQVYLCISGCYGDKGRESHGVAFILHPFLIHDKNIICIIIWNRVLISLNTS